mgnify:CR=1 FL=1
MATLNQGHAKWHGRHGRHGRYDFFVFRSFLLGKIAKKIPNYFVTRLDVCDGLSIGHGQVR